VTIRRAQLQDASALSDLLLLSFQPYPEHNEWLRPLVRLGLQSDLRQRIQHNQPQGWSYSCLVALQNEQVIGTVEISIRTPLFWHFQPSRYAYLANLAVHPDARQQGVGKRLLMAATHQVQQWQVKDLYLHVMENNIVARQLYLKAGYYIHQVEDGWSSWFRQPRRLFLHRRLGD
jgi:ribosomal protein S18 acetylase RimI-like enzyme